MKLVKPGDDLLTDENEPTGKICSMKMGIPEHEEPVASVMVVLTKAKQAYVGHQPGQEYLAHQICLQGAETMFMITHRALVESATKQIVGVSGDVRNLVLPPAPGTN